ncbi:MAG: hypothetical protein ACJ8FY_13165 [Gemmataceae bacterium]
MQRLCPQNFASARVRNQVTTASFHLDRPAVAPWVWDRTTSAYAFNAAAGYPQGQAIPFPTQRNPTPTTGDFDSATWRSSLDGVLGTALMKVDLNRRLDPYPGFPNFKRINLTGGGCCCGGPTPTMAVNQAIAQRQQMAKDILNTFLGATGAPDLTTIASLGATDVRFQAVRWLAQLSVNIVDYIDNDDYMTPFFWLNDNVNVVFGTELPRALINETYAELQDPTPTTGLNYSVNFWLELLNPLQNDFSLSEAGYARLNMPADGLNPNPYPVYVIYINQRPALAPDPYIRQPENTAGDPNPLTVESVIWNFSNATQSQPMQNFVMADPINNADAPNVIAPLGNLFSGPNGLNQGFFVLGPAGQNFQGAAATDTTVPVPTLSIPSAAPVGGATPVPRQGLVVDSHLPAATTNIPLTPDLFYSVVLRRLACPALPPNPAPGQPQDPSLPYNPYVTIDYVDTVKVNDGVTKRTAASGATPAIETRQAVGRNQPYTADVTHQALQQPQPTIPLKGQPQTTLFRHNSSIPPPPDGPAGKPDATDPTLKLPFDWLVHLDRKLLSPMELLNVSGFKPHELTQQFMAANQPFGHRAPWYDQNSLIHRFLEFVEPHERGLFSLQGGRIPGKININTIWDPETFQALCDASPSNYFIDNGVASPNPDDVIRIYKNLMTMRSPKVLSNHALDAGDLPILPLSNGFYTATDSQYPANLNSLGIAATGINRTIMQMGPPASGTSNQPLFDPIGDATKNPNLANLPVYQTPSQFGTNPQSNHPYIQKALLNKIFNNITTRSNVFAVWMTVGFFEVKDDTIQPVKLGPEIGRSENRHIRHRMFAIVDRSSLTTFTTQVNPSGVGIFRSLAPQDLTMLIPTNGVDARTGRPWQLQVGQILNFDPGTYVQDTEVFEENVLVLPGLMGLFTRDHQPGSKIQGFGNPGPWTRYDPRQDTTVVPYFSVID